MAWPSDDETPTSSRRIPHQRSPRTRRDAASPLVGLIIGAACAHPALAQETTFSLGVTSRAVLRGVAVVDTARPSLQAAANYYHASGWFGSIGATSIGSHDNVFEATQFIANLGYSRSLGDGWGAQLAFLHYGYLGNRQLRPLEYDELRAGVVYRNLFSVTLGFSPNTNYHSGRDREAVSIDACARYPLGRGFALEAGAGYYDLNRQFGLGYRYGNLGISLQIADVTLTASYIATDANAKDAFGRNAENRWTAGLTWAF